MKLTIKPKQMNFIVIDYEELADYVDVNEEWDKFEQAQLTGSVYDTYVDVMDMDHAHDPMYYKIGMVLSDEGEYVGHIYFIDPEQFLHEHDSVQYMCVQGIRKSIDAFLQGKHKGFARFVMGKCEMYVKSLGYNLAVEAPVGSMPAMLRAFGFIEDGDYYLLV